MLDLHAHTVASDGGDRPEELAAAAAGVRVLAVTDHDTVAGVAEARAAGERLGVEILAGCELTATVGDRVVHVLLYGEGRPAPRRSSRTPGYGGRCRRRPPRPPAG
jgi:predicted metal-dependent phosphoesterase TrpH